MSEGFAVFLCNVCIWMLAAIAFAMSLQVARWTKAFYSLKRKSLEVLDQAHAEWRNDVIDCRRC